MLTRNQVNHYTLAHLWNEAKVCSDAIWAKARSYDRPVKLYLHWSASRYGQFWEDYHLQIDGDGLIYMPAGKTLASQVSATAARNSGSIAICALCALDADTNSLGHYPPTPQQIESMARIIALLSNALDVPINIEHVMTHGEAADNEDGYNVIYDANGYAHGIYGPKHSCERWDLEYLGTSESPVFDPYKKQGFQRGGDVLRGKAIWYNQTYPQGVQLYF